MLQRARKKNPVSQICQAFAKDNFSPTKIARQLNAPFKNDKRPIFFWGQISAVQ